MKGTYIFLADSFEDVEALATMDILVRGGVDVQLVGIGEDPFVMSAHGLATGINILLEDLEDGGEADRTDFMIFPGGMPGAANLASCGKLISIMNAHYAEGGSVAAICAAPGLVLSNLDGVEGAEFTCYDGFQEPLIGKGCTYKAQPAVVSGRIITGRGPGYALEFGLEILKSIKGTEVAEQVRKGMYLTD